LVKACSRRSFHDCLSASNAQLKRLEPVHNKGLRIALGAFCVCRTENIMCESGFESLAEKEKAKNSSHPVNGWFKEKEAHEDYALKPKLSGPFFVRALKACSSLDTVERQLEHPPWIGDNMEDVNLQMTAIPNGTATARIKAEMEQTIEEGGLEEYIRVYTDGSLMEDRVGCAIICEAREIKIRLPKQISIFNAEAVAILEAIKATRRRGIAKKIILTDSLSNLRAQEKIYTSENSKIAKLKDLLA
jgi:hypothetical protein